MTAFSALVTGPVGGFSSASRGRERGLAPAVGEARRSALRSPPPPPPPQPASASSASERTMAGRISLLYAPAPDRISGRLAGVERNWAGNHAYGARELHRPATLEELQELVASSSRIRVLGTRHSFNAIADSEALVSLERLPADVTADREAGAISLPGGMSYGALAPHLERHGLALANLASLPHISVAGAVATAAHRPPRRPGLRRPRRRARRARRRRPARARRRARLRGAPGGLRGTRLGHPARAPRRDLRERLRRQRVLALGRGRRPGLAQAARRGDARRALRRAGSQRGPAPDPRQRPDPRDAPARRSRPVGAAAAPLPAGVHSQQRGGAAVRVPRAAPPRRRRDRGAARGRRGDPRAFARERAAYGRRRRAVAEPAARRPHARHPLHLGARARARGGRDGGRRAGARAVRAAPALGQAVPDRPRRARRALPEA